MRRWQGRIAAAALWAGMAAAPAAAVPINYDCDTAPSSYSMIDLVQPGPDYRITGRITPVQWRRGPWQPVATVGLISSDNRNVVALRIARTGGGPAAITLQSMVKGDQRLTDAGTVGLKQQVPFELALVNGKATLRVGAKSVTTEMVLGAGAKVQVTCSTGQFMFKDLDWEAR